LHKIHEARLDDSAKLCRVMRLGVMIEIRKEIDEMETCVPPECWSLASYQDLWFIDQNS
jgi:glutamine synthetase type III